ncbi:(2Fe-2S)-binding protein [Fodinicola acaciae]|uniref:(2Fe-2S)-binding protein n=1 Tax=Fodinicola acaciae TaxID=2681555 RepID=UPI0013D34238|nr:(2Fe-2S)-binding protein [Fodinicola acaciae]
MEVRGELVRDIEWLAGQIEAAKATYRTGDERVAGTMWWYAASWSLLVQPASEPGMDPRLDAIVLDVRPGGLISASRSTRTLDGDLATALRDLFAETIASICVVTGQRDRPLWAIAADSLATQQLAVGRPEIAVGLGKAIGDPLPLPRFEEVQGKLFVRRTSCCLIYRVPGNDLCTSCPKRPADDRRRRLSGY